jgi:hypothetical protein
MYLIQQTHFYFPVQMTCCSKTMIITYITILHNALVKGKCKWNLVTGPGEPIVWVEVQLNSFLTSALEGVVWSASRPGRLYTQKDPEHWETILLPFFGLHPFGRLHFTSPSPSPYKSRAVSQWLKHYATNRQVVGSIPDGVIGIFQWHNPTGRTMALGSTQPLTEMSTRCISWG